MYEKDEKTVRYEFVAHQIDREDGLMHYRLTWALTMNGFLFAALGFLGAKDKPDPSMLAFFHGALPITGVIINSAALSGVRATHLQIEYLTGYWSKLEETRWPRPFGKRDHWFGSFALGTIPALAAPIALLVLRVWLARMWW